MKIALIGATGFVGTALSNELASRKINVTAIARKPGTFDSEYVKYAVADIFDTPALAAVLKGHDAVISSFNPGWENPNLYHDFINGSKSIQQAVKDAGISRLIVIGGGGSLFIAPGVQVVDTPEFPKEYHEGATAARDYLNVIREEKDLDWAFFSPALEMHQGITTGRTGKYRLGLENPVFNEEGRSILSVEDLSVVIADEVEHPKHQQQRFTAGY